MQTVITKLVDPSKPGPFTFKNVVYAAPNLNYKTNPDLAQYLVFQTPTIGYTTRRINLEGIADLGFGVDWPFTSSQVPINGLMCIPIGQGPFPLVVFAHGNHSPLENSTPGYLYLCELLASHGIIAATIDANFLNGGNFGENDGRAILHLEHIRQFLFWNVQPRHPLQRKIDLSRVMVVGHSRGGEAVGHASLFKTLKTVQFDELSPPVPLDGSRGLGPYSFFDLKAVVAIAPTDSQYTPVSGSTRVLNNYFVMHGSRDGDVFTFEGYKTYDRSHAVDLSNPTKPALGFKSLLWVHGANHNYFNSVWQQESQNTIDRKEQEQIAKVYLSALAQALLLDKMPYLELFKNYAFGESWLPAKVKLVSQYQDARRLFIQHCEEPEAAIVVSKPAVGTVNTVDMTAQKLAFTGTDPFAPLYQETQGIQLQWEGREKSYSVRLDPASLNLKAFKVLAFRIGQSTEPNNPEGQQQNFMIEVRDDARTVAIPASSVSKLIYPDQVPLFDGQFLTRIVMQTLRIPFSLLRERGLNVEKLTEIKFIFGVIPSGTLYLDELQLTH